MDGAFVPPDVTLSAQGKAAQWIVCTAEQRLYVTWLSWTMEIAPSVRLPRHSVE
jgi:hypothetical protein